MTDRFDSQAVRQVAHLARLKISDDEVTMYARQLADVLEYMQQLNAVNTQNVPPSAHPHDITNVLRADAPQSSCAADDALRNTPQRHGDFFKVPKVLDQETA